MVTTDKKSIEYGYYNVWEGYLHAQSAYEVYNKCIYEYEVYNIHFGSNMSVDFMRSSGCHYLTQMATYVLAL